MAFLQIKNHFVRTFSKIKKKSFSLDIVLNKAVVQPDVCKKLKSKLNAFLYVSTKLFIFEVLI